MRYVAKTLAIGFAGVLMAVSIVGSAGALSFQPNRIVDDSYFDNANSMSAGAIDAFLNSFANSCISPNSGFRAIDPTGYNPSGGYQYGGFVTAGQVIYDAAQAYSLNPQVLLTTLEKEQSLVTGRNNFSGYCNNGEQHKYAAAVGYGCPDSGTTYNYSGVNLYQRNGTTVSSTGTTCVNSSIKAGFSQQVIRAAWLFKFGEQRSKGNIGWAVIKGSWDNSDDPQTCYGGPMTQGTWQRCPSGGSAYYDGYTTIDGSATHIDTGATAALYWYTPHFHGNQNFFDLFVGWFGSPISGNCLPNGLTASSTGVIFSTPHSGPATAKFVIYSGSSTNCVEFHSWNGALNNWSKHVASNSQNISLLNSDIQYADINGTGTDVPILVALRGTGSGMIEFHVWNADEQNWSQHIISNMPVIDPAVSLVRFGDVNGDGKDEAILAGIGNGSTSTGNIEFHIWNPGFQSWNTHIVSNSHTINRAASRVFFADMNADGKDEGVLVGNHYPTGSGYIEFHIWNAGLQNWSQHLVSNQPLAP